MIGMVLIAHEHIAREMVAAVEHVVGKTALLKAVNVRPDHDPELLNRELQAALAACETGDGVLVLADMFGGTPCNIAIGSMRNSNVEVISGFNLPMLIKAVHLRKNDLSLTALAQQVVAAGRKYICQASERLGKGTPACQDPRTNA